MIEEKYTLSKKLRYKKRKKEKKGKEKDKKGEKQEKRKKERKKKKERNVTSVKHNLYCSRTNSSYMYMFELAINHRKAVYKEAGR